MWKKTFIIGGVFLLIVGILAIAGAFRKSKSRRALETYTAELRAQGELLTWAELGTPWSSATNAAVDAFLAAAKRLDRPGFRPGYLEYMHFSSPGTAQVGRAGSRLPVSPDSPKHPTWDEFTAEMNAVTNELAEIRAFLADPPSLPPLIGTNQLDSKVRISFVSTRGAAQWLAADALAALHAGDPDRALADLNALARLARLHQDHDILVSVMVSTAVAGLGLEVTWEGLTVTSWGEDELADLQSEWEAIDLIGAFEGALLGELVSGLHWFENPSEVWVVLASPRGTGAGTPGGLAALRDDVLEQAGTMYWHAHSEEDQLLFLRTTKQQLDLVRQLKTNAPAVEILQSLQKLQDEAFQSILGAPLAQYRHKMTSVLIPNYSRAADTMVRNETQRRMTVIVIALRRYLLQAGKYPETLDELVPRLLSKPIVDPMSGRPFGYRTNDDGTFTLYSVGEDGIDDGGDPVSAEGDTSFDLWSGRDVVWPRADTNPPSAHR